MKLIIGNKNYSSWSLRAWLAAREGGFTFEEIRIPLFIPGSRDRIPSRPSCRRASTGSSRCT